MADPAATKTFSEHAHEKMHALMADYGTQCGSKYTGDCTGKSKTDCITYVRLVLEYAFEKVGDPAGVAGVRANYQKGTQLAQFLVGKGWRAYYWNPDVRHPSDGGSEHPVSNGKVVKTGRYYEVPVTGRIVDYNCEDYEPGMIAKFFGSTNVKKDDFAKFTKVRFAFGLARGGMHTFLVSYGDVYEVHWDQIGSGLYEKSPLMSYEWLSGLVVVPPDSGFVL